MPDFLRKIESQVIISDQICCYYRFQSDLQCKLQSIMNWQQTVTCSKVKHLTPHIIEKSFNIVKNQYSISWNCSQMSIITKRIKSYPCNEHSNLVENTCRLNDKVASLGFEVQTLRSNSIKPPNRSYQRWSAHKEKLRGLSVGKAYFCPLRPFRSQTKHVNSTKNNFSDLLLEKRMNMSNTQSPNSKPIKRVFLQQILLEQKRSIMQPSRLHSTREERLKKMKRSVIVSRQQSPLSIRGWDIEKAQQDNE